MRGARGFEGLPSVFFAVVVEAGIYPSFAKEGWTRPKENAAKHPLTGADGVVVSSDRLLIRNHFDKRCLETTTPSAPNKERGHFLYCAATPPSRRRGIASTGILLRPGECGAA